MRTDPAFRAMNNLSMTHSEKEEEEEEHDDKVEVDVKDARLPKRIKRH
jgi:hypothetical protein